jgi:hypothetical protein
LLDLQDAVLALTQNTTKIHLHHLSVYEETKRFGRDYLPEALNLASGEVRARASLLGHRVIDQEVRDQLDALSELCTTIVMPTVAPQTDEGARMRARDEWLRLPDATSRLQTRIGVVLRSLL